MRERGDCGGGGANLKMNDIEFMMWNDVSTHKGVKLSEQIMSRLIHDLNISFVVQLKSLVMKKRYINMNPSDIDWAQERQSDAECRPGRILFVYDNFALFVTRYAYKSMPDRVDLDPTVSEVVTLAVQPDGRIDMMHHTRPSVQTAPMNLAGDVDRALQVLTTQPLDTLTPFAGRLFDICQRIETRRLDAITSSGSNDTYT